jgi:4-hydroxybenzoate polyprenyltransferase
MKVQQISSSNIFTRFWIYQAERFPVFGHGLLIAAFSFSAVSFSTLLRGQVEWPGAGTVLVGFASAFLFFLQLRLADEFKDFEEDSRYRPYRPVPRGLVTLRQLGVLGALTALIQLGLALWLDPALLPLLLLVWGYLALMSKEFFARDWLKARPITYMWSHMLIVPLIDFYTTACDWLVAGEIVPHSGLAWFLVVSFFNGIVIEIGRKIRAPQDEELGVETYTVLWGRSRAVMAWLGALFLTALSAWLAAREIGFARPVGWLLAVLLVIGLLVALRFLGRPVTGHAKLIETMSGMWTILMYLSVGAIPLLMSLTFDRGLLPPYLLY